MSPPRRQRLEWPLAAVLALLMAGCALPIAPQATVPPPVQHDLPDAQAPKVEEVGKASFYGPAFDGKETASGATFDQKKLTAAHRSLPLGSKAVVTNLKTGKSVEVTINDRGPYVKGRAIDLSVAAAQQIGLSKDGVAKVKIQTTPRHRKTKKRAATTHQASE